MTEQVAFLEMFEAVLVDLVSCEDEFGFMESEKEGDRVGSGTYRMIQASVFETLAKGGWAARDFEREVSMSAHPYDRFDVVRFL